MMKFDLKVLLGFVFLRALKFPFMVDNPSEIYYVISIKLYNDEKYL